MSKRVLTPIILIFVVFAGCSPTTGTVQLTFKEMSVEITEVVNETIHMNNCGGKGDAKQSAERSKSVHVEYDGSLGVEKLILYGEISAKYGEEIAIAKKIELVAPAGTNMEFNVEWKEKSWIGIVTSQGKDGQANYKVSVPISVTLLNSNDLGCDVSTNGNSTPTISSPTNILHDDFNNPSNDGSFNPETWFTSNAQKSRDCDISQSNGMLEFSNSMMPATWSQCGLTIKDSAGIINFSNLLTAKTKMMLVEHQGNYANVNMVLSGNSSLGKGWYANCGIDASSSGVAASTNFGTNVSNSMTYYSYPIDIDTWYLLQFKIDPMTMTFSCFVNDQLVSSVTPGSTSELKISSDELKASSNITWWLSIYTESGTSAKVLMDDVTIESFR